MAAIPSDPPPLAIRLSRDRVKAVQDIILWVENFSGRKKKTDPENTAEVRHMMHFLEVFWKSLESGDGVLFERNAAKQVVASVFDIPPEVPFPYEEC